MLKRILFLYLLCSQITFAAGRVAMISLERLQNDPFDLATEAVNNGANILLFPELGFIAQQDDIEASVLESWSQFAVGNQVIVVFNTRHLGRNTVFLFDPNGGRKLAVRRDGNGSPVPNTTSEMLPLIHESSFGKFGVLICDEARIQRFVDEVQELGVDFLLVPNNTYAATTAEWILGRAQAMSYEVDVFHADMLKAQGLFPSASKLTFKYDAATTSVEFTPFGQSASFGEWTEFPVRDNGESYLISYHDISTSED